MRSAARSTLPRGLHSAMMLARHRCAGAARHPCSRAAELAGLRPMREAADRRWRPCRQSELSAVWDKFKAMMGGSGGDSTREDGQEREMEESTMVRIDTDSDGGVDGSEEVFGPLAVLLVGFMQREVDDFRRMMQDMDADMVKIIPCSRVMMAGTLGQALESQYPQYEQPPLGTRRMLVMSGMYGSEVVEVIAAFKDAGLAPTAFAAAVPNNWDRQLGELLESVIQDQDMAARRQQERAAQQQSTGQDS